LDNRIKNLFKTLDISRSDTIVIHGDAGIAFELKDQEIKDRVPYLIDLLIDFVGNDGTLVVPAFSYSFTRKEDFDVDNTQSCIGAFSEVFRLHPLTQRSKNPNFSFSSIGKNSEQYSNARIDDCFGASTAFDLMFKQNAKIVCLGCDFNRITFAHYVEQKIGVDYRYVKSFPGNIIYNGLTENIINTYYVRSLDFETQGELNEVKKRALKKGFLRIANFGRFPVLSIEAKNFYSVSKELLAENPHALIKHRLN
jgi:aminoglycoside 3-N-acetyltransferase